MFKVTPFSPDRPRNLRWWYEQYMLGKLDFEPPYQRRSLIWSKWKRAHLIDSLINEFDVPKFYIANFANAPYSKLNLSHKPFALIDGKQRFNSIFDFFEDKFELNPTSIFDDDPSVKLARLKFSELVIQHPAIAQRIENFIPTVMSVVADDTNRIASDRKIEELFVRLNSGEAATGAERRNAMGGPIPRYVREISLHPFFQRKIAFTIRRMQDHQLIGKLLMIEYRERFTDTKQRNLESFTKQAYEWEISQMEIHGLKVPLDVGEYADARDRVVSVLDRLAPEFKDKDPLLSKSGSIPIYYWFARQHPKYVNELHDFLVYFSERIGSAVSAQKAGGKLSDGDTQLAAFYTMSRTTNDGGSLEGRYRIFEERFRDYQRPVQLRKYP